MKKKNDVISRLEEKTNQITATMKQLEQRWDTLLVKVQDTLIEAEKKSLCPMCPPQFTQLSKPAAGLLKSLSHSLYLTYSKVHDSKKF